MPVGVWKHDSRNVELSRTSSAVGRTGNGWSELDAFECLLFGCAAEGTRLRVIACTLYWC